MNEYTILKNSRKVCLLGLLIATTSSIVTRDVSYMLGFVLGYSINVLTFLAIIQSSSAMLSMRGGAVGIVMIMFIVKLLLYALGFLLAFKLPSIFNIIGVFIGYFVIKITIFIDTYKNKGGELNG